MKHFSAKKAAGVGLLTALALIAYILEGLFPPLFIAGAKLGVSNVFTLLALLLYGGGSALVTVIVKCLLGGLFSGNPSAIIYSLPASLTALAFEYAFLRFLFDKFSVIAVSVGGAVLHNVVQNAVFCLVTDSTAVFSLLPYLALLGALAGVAVGFAVYLTLKILPKDILDKITKN